MSKLRGQGTNKELDIQSSNSQFNNNKKEDNVVSEAK